MLPQGKGICWIIHYLNVFDTLWCLINMSWIKFTEDRTGKQIQKWYWPNKINTHTNPSLFSLWAKVGLEGNSNKLLTIKNKVISIRPWLDELTFYCKRKITCLWGLSQSPSLLLCLSVSLWHTYTQTQIHIDTYWQNWNHWKIKENLTVVTWSTGWFLNPNHVFVLTRKKMQHL